MDTIIINSSDETVNIVDPVTSVRKKFIKRSPKRKVIQEQGKEVIILRRRFRINRRFRETDIHSSFKKPNICVNNIPKARIVPCCLRKLCVNNIIPDKTKKRKFYAHVHPSRSYEGGSSDSSKSDSQLDKVLIATRKRMNNDIHEQVTPIIRELTPNDEICSETTFDLNSVHSMDTVNLEEADELPILEILDPQSPTSDHSASVQFVPNVYLDKNNQAFNVTNEFQLKSDEKKYVKKSKLK